MIEETADYLFSLSTSVRLDPVSQNGCYEAFLTLQTEAKLVVENMHGGVDNAFATLSSASTHNPEKPASDLHPELALLDLEVFEETLAIEKIVKASTERFWVELESLMFRLGSLLEIPAAEIKLPVSPRLICSLYRQSLRDIQFPSNYLVDADSAFARKLLPELADIYRQLNLYLKEMGLLPHIEDELNQTGSQLLMNLANRPTDAKHIESLYPAEDIPLISEVERLDLENHKLIHETDWINKVSSDIASSGANSRPFSRATAREATASPEELKASGGKSGFIPPKIEPPSRDDSARNRLLSSTQQLLEQRPVPSLEMESECLRIARALAKLRREDKSTRFDLASLLKFIGFQPQAAVTERLREAHKISARLINYLLQRLSPSEAYSSAFVKLEICFLELALVDPNFLIEGDHPGRVLVDRLTDLATLFPRNDDKHLAGLVDVLTDLTGKFDGADGSLVAASATLSELSLKLIKQQRQNKERLITRENAKDKIDNARLVLIDTLDRFFENRSANKSLVDCVATVFVDRWVVAILKGAPLQKIEAELKTLWDIANSQHTALPEDNLLLNLGQQIDLPSELTRDAKSALACLFRPSDHENSRLENWGLDVDLTLEQLNDLLATRPRLRRSANAIQKLPVDTWFKHETESGYRYLQIVWTNRHGTRFVLSDERGIKQRDVSLVQLALEFDRSLKRLSTVERLSLVEQTLFSKLSAVQEDVSQRFSQLHKDSAAVLAYEVERLLRRVKRSGERILALGFTLAEEKPHLSLEKAIADTENTHGSVCRLSSSRVCAVGPFEAEMLRKIIRETYGTTANYEFILQDVTQEHANDINTLIASLIQSDKQARENSSGATLEETKPFVLDQAVETAMNYMAPLANKLRLRTLIRVPVADASKIQTAFRVESLRANSASEGNETNAQQRSVRIASNLTELREVCKLLNECDGQQRARPQLILKLSADTCMYSAAQDQILSLISEYAIGTSQLSFLISDSLLLRESTTCQRLTRALRSIGCHIILDNYNPERAREGSNEQLNATEIVIDTQFWERAAQAEPWRSLLPQLITDTHHILGQAVSVRDPKITDDIEQTGIDYIERESDVLLSTSELLRSLTTEFS